jgi:CHAT domain-containing protein
MADQTGDDLLHVETLLLRASVETKMDRHEAAQADLRQAELITARIGDPTFRQRAEADRIGMQGLLASAPADAVEVLGRAIEFNRGPGRDMLLPDMYLHRGRAFAALRNPGAAATDFEAGIAELEKQRKSVAPGEERLGVFATAQELFEEAIALSLARSDVPAAFAYTERARARELLEELGTSQRSAGRPAGGPEPLIVEYAALPSRLVIFVADRGRVSAVQQDVAREALTRTVDLLTQSALTNDNAKFRRAAAVLYGFLIAPVGDQIVAGRELVFVPDATLRAVPFSALVDPTGRFLVETHALVVAPSAAVFLRLAASSRSPDQTTRLLIISGPVAIGGDPGQLSNAKRESDAVAESYSDVSRLLARDSRPDELAAQAARADVIHFVGHAGSSDSGATLLTSPRAGAEGQLDVRAIAALRLPRTRVVVLAACSTARGEERGQEGSISVARAFLAAGVPSVVATLWPIDDTQAADFFPRLHQQLARGVSPAQALRAAQLESIHGRSLPLAIWAAVQVIGS